MRTPAKAPRGVPALPRALLGPGEAAPTLLCLWSRTSHWPQAPSLVACPSLVLPVTRVLSRHSSLASHSMAENGLAPSITVEQEMLGSVLPTVPWPLEAEPHPTCFLEGLPCLWGRGLEPRQKSKTEQMGVRRLG